MKKRSLKSQPQKVAAQPRRSQSKLATAVHAAVAKTTLSPPVATSTSALASDIGHLIESARQHVAQTANAALTTLYWQIGARIHRYVLRQQRAEYGGQIVSALGRELEERYGRGFGEKSIRHMVRFVEAFPDAAIVSAVRRQLSWTHFRQIIYLDDSLKRDFYLEMCQVEAWSTRVLLQVHAQVR